MSNETSDCHSEGPPEESLRPYTSMNFLFRSSNLYIIMMVSLWLRKHLNLIAAV